MLLSASHFAVSPAVFRFSAAPKGAWPSLQGGRCYKHGAPNGAEPNRRLFRLLKARHTGQPEVELQHPPARLILNPAVQKPRITRMTLKRAVQPQMDTDEHRFTASCRATPPHPQGERLRRGLHQCSSVFICGFIVSTAVLRLIRLFPLSRSFPCFPALGSLLLCCSTGASRTDISHHRPNSEALRD